MASRISTLPRDSHVLSHAAVHKNKLCDSRSRARPQFLTGAVRRNRLLGVIVPSAPEYNMGGFLRRNELNAFVSQRAHVNPLEQSLSPAQQDRRDSDVQLINEARTKILLDSVRSAANAHIHSVGCVARPVKRLANTARDEVECRSALRRRCQIGSVGTCVLGLTTGANLSRPRRADS
jgi:hypothetical protein